MRKDKTNIEKILKNEYLIDMDVNSKELWLRARIVMQFVTLREIRKLSQNDVAIKMNVLRQQITRFENMTNSPTISFLVRYATALDTTMDVILNGVELKGTSNEGY
jgi:transcriptional regulator with XRE-family HTH domain